MLLTFRSQNKKNATSYFEATLTFVLEYLVLHNIIPKSTIFIETITKGLKSIFILLQQLF